jgi:hypothetical protein
MPFDQFERAYNRWIAALEYRHRMNTEWARVLDMDGTRNQREVSGWAMCGAGQLFHYIVGGKRAICGFDALAQTLYPARNQSPGLSYGDCPDCHRALKEKSHAQRV